MPLTSEQIQARLRTWVGAHADDSQELLSYKAFWVEFFACFGVVADKAGITFQRRALRKNTGRDGLVDVFWSAAKGGDGVLIEHKTRGQLGPRPDGTSDAEAQAFDYLDGGTIAEYEQPRWVIVSDFATITLIDRFANSRAHRSVTLRMEEVPDRLDLFAWVSGQQQVGIAPVRVQASASIEAARLMGELYAAYTGDADTPTVQDKSNEDPRTEEASVLLTRLLFLMYGEDAGLLAPAGEADDGATVRGIFSNFILDHTNQDGSDLGALLKDLFGVLNMPEDSRPPRMSPVLAEFPYVNGDVFAPYSFTNLYFDTAMRDALVKACLFDWSNISPAVFGSLFQTVKSRQARHSDGEHYTSETNILKVLGPMFLDNLTARVAKARTQKALIEIQREMGRLRFLDPACGCGNFLIVAYREMRRLEHQIIAKLIDTASRSHMIVEGLDLDVESLIQVRLDSFYGIELNWWPAKIAETAMFLIDHQMNRELHQQLTLKLNRLPIKIAPTIHHGNALVDPDETAANGDVLRPYDWNRVVPKESGTRLYVFGNPPFLGHYVRGDLQGRELAAAWGVKTPPRWDFVTGWHAQAVRFMADRDGEFAYVTTNSITQGEPVSEVFSRIGADGWRIKFAHRTFAWNSEVAAKERAAVHCVIVGFTRAPEPQVRVFDYADLRSAPTERSATRLNGYLVDGPETYPRKRRLPLAVDLPPTVIGSRPTDGGGWVVAGSDRANVAADPVAAKYLRRFVGARELIHNEPRWCIWSPTITMDDLRRSAFLQERWEHVADFRSKSVKTETRERAETPHVWEINNQPSTSYVCIPRHFSGLRPYVTVARFEPDVVAGDANYICPDPDGIAFAALSSKMFLTWQATIGGRLKSDFRFMNGLVWNNFPLSPLTGAQRVALINAGQAVLAARVKHPERSLADHYSATTWGVDSELLAAHRALDRTMDGIFGLGRRPSEGDRQTALFAQWIALTSPSGI